MMDSIILRRFVDTDFALSSETFRRNKTQPFRPSVLQAFTLNSPQEALKCVRTSSEMKKRKKNQETSSHIALIPAQLFAIMPVSGITAKSAKHLKFTWINLRTLHTAIIMCGLITMATISISWASYNNAISITILERIIWFSSKSIVMAYFLWLAKKWPTLMLEWERIEQTLPAYVGRKKNFAFFNQIKVHTILISTSLFIEHTMSIMAGVYRVQLCSNSTSVEGYFKQAWPQIYTLVKYDGGMRGFLIELLNYYCVFLWTFMDIFIICISICLSTRFNQLNEHLKQFMGMKMNATFWSDQRRHFTALSTLISNVNNSVSKIAAFSMSSNLYYILLQLLHSFQPQGTIFETIYFWYSLAFLVTKTMLVSLSAARINDESKKSANVIRAIPNEGYDVEANRFLEQIVNTKVGLTGMRFFYFTRPLILSVVGTIITYELVLVQFQILTPKSKLSLCQAF